MTNKLCLIAFFSFLFPSVVFSIEDTTNTLSSEQIEMQNASPDFRFGADIGTWDRGAGYEVSAGVFIQKSISLLIAVGTHQYSDSFRYIQSTPYKHSMNANTIDLLVQYDSLLTKWIGLGLSGGIGQLSGQSSFTYRPYSDRSNESTKNFENYALVFKPTIYLRTDLYRSFALQAGLGLHLKALRDESYSFLSPGEEMIREKYPEGFRTRAFAFVDIIF